jgi:hypothetical protein
MKTRVSISLSILLMVLLSTSNVFSSPFGGGFSGSFVGGSGFTGATGVASSSLAFINFTPERSGLFYAGIDIGNPFSRGLGSYFDGSSPLAISQANLIPDENNSYTPAAALSVPLNATITSVPVPSAVLLLGSGLIGLTGLRRKFRRA